MLRKIIAVLCICLAETVLLTALWPRPQSGPDAAALNALVRSAELSGGDYSRADAGGLGFSVVGRDGHVLYASGPDLPSDPLTAAAAGNIVLPLQDDLIIVAVNTAGPTVTPFLAAMTPVCVSGALMVAYVFWLEQRIVRPFRNIRHTAEAIAAGHLDFPLRMDRGGIFGPFTESFDLMRSELARAQAAEAQASQDKRDLIAKLSHDLRTPVASIQAVSELGSLTGSEADRGHFSQIAGKAVQLNNLISNLLNAALEEQTGFTIAARPVSAAEIADLLAGADYLHWLAGPVLPCCTVLADPVRLQQIFDNILSNAYKYACGPVTAAGFIQNGELLLEIGDAGPGVGPDELERLPLRGFRGRNADHAPGSGLGLYICRQLIEAMGGELLIANGGGGLEITLALPLAQGSAGSWA
ncbi:MAG: HAMP domain-containing histidine kinase [Clostridia bacterium]|nr:HAMP domain-containing histidine kinase [Clostridia bacterium]